MKTCPLNKCLALETPRFDVKGVNDILVFQYIQMSKETQIHICIYLYQLFEN